MSAPDQRSAVQIVCDELSAENEGVYTDRLTRAALDEHAALTAENERLRQGLRSVLANMKIIPHEPDYCAACHLKAAITKAESALLAPQEPK